MGGEAEEAEQAGPRQEGRREGEASMREALADWRLAVRDFLVGINLACCTCGAGGGTRTRVRAKKKLTVRRGCSPHRRVQVARPPLDFPGLPCGGAGPAHIHPEDAVWSGSDARVHPCFSSSFPPRPVRRRWRGLGTPPSSPESGCATLAAGWEYMAWPSLRARRDCAATSRRRAATARVISVRWPTLPGRGSVEPGILVGRRSTARLEG